jgi:anthranilate synthase component 1/para-aminobenzoate synthetase component 1
MTWPTEEQFKELSLENKIIPLWKCLPIGKETPISVYERLGGPEDHSFIFESGKGTEKIARYSNDRNLNDRNLVFLYSG